MFFQVNEIQVLGETRYTVQQVIDASGLALGDHLFFVNSEAAEREIQTGLPYIDRAELRRRFPNRLEITVSETFSVAQIQIAGGYLVLDKNAKILEWQDEAPGTHLVKIIGLPEPVSPQPGDILDLGGDGQDCLRYLQNILGTATTLGLINRISYINMTDLHAPIFLYDDRFTVRLGPNLDLYHKMDMLVGIVAYYAEADVSGVIDLSLDRPIFRPHEADAPHAPDAHPYYGE